MEALLEEFGGEQMELSVGTLLSNGPESTKLDHKKVSFMQENWASVAEALGDDFAQQIAAGEPRPRVQLRDWVRAMREGSTPELRASLMLPNASSKASSACCSSLVVNW